ncbi:MAG TPA: FAD-dependent oxidoreductase [Micromonosporaceae bacterium]|nr:FAD-dependent oxidoreductase [Micromonosporaceae bacterium]
MDNQPGTRRRVRPMREPNLLDRWDAQIVIAGGGPAAKESANELRRLGFRGGITVLSGEADAPYDRPACSKALLSGEKRPKHVQLQRPGPRVEWINTRALDLDPDRRLVLTESGELFPYDGLVIATGGHGSFPKGWPAPQYGLHNLQTVSDAWAVRQELRDAERVVIVGGGLTGSETAYTVRKLARRPIIIDSKQQLMHRAIGAQMGAVMTDVHAEENAELVLGRRVDSIRRHNSGWQVKLSDGRFLNADLVVVTTGERPETGWLADSGLDVSDGVLCDEYLRVVGADRIVAAGSIARWPNPRYADKPGRCGQWIAALEQGRMAARTLLLGPSEPAAILPRFWSLQHDLRIQVAGQIDEAADIAVTELNPRRRDVARAGVLTTYHRRGRLVGLSAINAAPLFNAMIRPMLAEQPRFMSPAEALDETGLSGRLVSVA